MTTEDHEDLVVLTDGLIPYLLGAVTTAWRPWRRGLAMPHGDRHEGRHGSLQDLVRLASSKVPLRRPTLRGLQSPNRVPTSRAAAING
jgi:hypothetical protein